MAEEHPEWFLHRPDGTIKYAENPPKKYQDIVNVNWESEDWRGLWEALRDVVLHWMSHGVRVFRVDNPHTKPLPFWEWLIAETRKVDDGVIFLAEAFTRPAMMGELAKVGFNQSYTYFTWRNTREELEEYITELATEWADFYRPNFFANTPDILHEYLSRGRAAGVRGAARARGDALAELRHLLGLRELRERAGQAGQRGVPRLGEVRAQEAHARGAAAAARPAPERRSAAPTARCSGSTTSRSSRRRTTT